MSFRRDVGVLLPPESRHYQGSRGATGRLPHASLLSGVRARTTVRLVPGWLRRTLGVCSAPPGRMLPLRVASIALIRY